MDKNKLKKEFYEKINELDNFIPSAIIDNEDTPLMDFGYKTRRKDEFFTVVDWGEIWSWFEKVLEEQEKEHQKGSSDFLSFLKGRSICCKEKVTVGGIGDFGYKDRVSTNYYVCMKCGNPCDVY
jgi:hypothetical protein